MSSILFVMLPISFSASLIFLELLVMERILKGEYTHLLLVCMKIVTGFFLFPAIVLACFAINSILDREVILANLDDIKWIIRGEILFSDLPIVQPLLSKMLVLWLTGICIFLVIRFIRADYLLKRLLSKCALADKHAIACKNKLLLQYKINGSVELLKSAEIRTPFLTGILYPKIVIPDRCFSDKELEMILAHELTHLKNRDVLFKSIASIVQCFNWFNPIIYIYLNKVYEFCEYACDEKVTKICNKEEKEQYARLVVSLAGEKRVYEPSMTFVSCEVKVMKRRVYYIMKQRKKKTNKKVAVAVAAILAMCPAAVYASAFGIAQNQSELVKTYDETYFMDAGWNELNGEPVKVNLVESENTIMVTRGTNEIDETISAGKTIKLILRSLTKGQLIRVYLTADSSSDQFSVTISDSSGNGNRYSSENGDVYISYTVPASGEYSIFIRETSGKRDVHLTGTVKVD